MLCVALCMICFLLSPVKVQLLAHGTRKSSILHPARVFLEEALFNTLLQSQCQKLTFLPVYIFWLLGKWKMQTENLLRISPTKIVWILFLLKTYIRLHFLPVGHQKEESEPNRNLTTTKLAGKHRSKTLQRSPTLQSQRNLPPIDSANQETHKLLQVNPNPINIRNMKVPVNNSCQSQAYKQLVKTCQTVRHPLYFQYPFRYRR